MIVLSRHQLVEIHEQEPIMVRGDGSQHFVELIDTGGGGDDCNVHPSSGALS